MEKARSIRYSSYVSPMSFPVDPVKIVDVTAKIKKTHTHTHTHEKRKAPKAQTFLGASISSHTNLHHFANFDEAKAGKKRRLEIARETRIEIPRTFRISVKAIVGESPI